MNIFLGNLSVDQIMERSGVKFSDADIQWMNERRSQKTELPDGTWHCYDLPFMIICKTKDLAKEVADRLGRYDWRACKEALQISWEPPKEEKDGI